MSHPKESYETRRTRLFNEVADLFHTQHVRIQRGLIKRETRQRLQRAAGDDGPMFMGTPDTLAPGGDENDVEYRK